MVALAGEKHLCLTHPQCGCSLQVNHNVEIIGWGETASGVKYWIGRNSWGTYWGEGGFFRLGRGYGMDKNLRVEQDCQWMVPEWRDLDDVLDGTGHSSSGILFCLHPIWFPSPVLSSRHPDVHYCGHLCLRWPSHHTPPAKSLIMCTDTCVPMLHLLARVCRELLG